MRAGGPIVLLLLLTGCARYEHEIVRPQDLAAHIGRKTDTLLPRDPLEYRLRTVDNRLVMRIYNLSDEPIQLMGEQSWVVDPDGQSHPLRSQILAPGSYIRLVLPPLPPRVQRVGPSFGFGVGTRIGYHYGGNPHHRWYPYHHYGAYHPLYEEPLYFRIIDDEAYYWDWRGEGQIRLDLIFEHAGQRFEHDFVIRRVKM